MRKMIAVGFIGLLAAFAACSPNGGLPRNAKLVGNFYLTCTEVQQGMYHCRIYARSDRKLALEKTFISPSYYDMPPRGDISSRVSRYEGNVIYLWGGKKLVAGDIPEDAQRVQSADGGVWVSCSLEDKKTNTYVCTIYSMKDAGIRATGAYVPKRFAWDPKAGRVRYQDIQELIPEPRFIFYGGIGITLPDKRILMPAEWIDYPNRNNGGLRVQYSPDGKVMTREEY
jgi:hypothetical protein